VRAESPLRSPPDHDPQVEVGRGSAPKIPRGFSPSGTTSPAAPTSRKDPAGLARRRSRRPPRSTRTSATTLRTGTRRGRGGNLVLGPLPPRLAPRGHRTAGAQRRRGRHAVAPSSMSAWFRSPGRSLSSSAEASDTRPAFTAVNGDPRRPGEAGEHPRDVAVHGRGRDGEAMLATAPAVYGPNPDPRHARETPSVDRLCLVFVLWPSGALLRLRGIPFPGDLNRAHGAGCERRADRAARCAPGCPVAPGFARRGGRGAEDEIPGRVPRRVPAPECSVRRSSALER